MEEFCIEPRPRRRILKCSLEFKIKKDNNAFHYYG